jgi:spore maturation protein CgeB
MKLIYFTHSLRSCWNHGNAHFLRGLGRALLDLGHEIDFYEPGDSWSRQNLASDQGSNAELSFARSFPDLSARSHTIRPDIDGMLAGADAVLVHEWTDPVLVAAIGRRRANGASFKLLFHDTHHRMASDPAAMAAFDLSGFDGVLAFGQSLADAYRRGGWADRVFTWHEAADTSTFLPPGEETPRKGVVWIGNWGDGERSDELHSYLLQPVARLNLPLDIHGVRYPAEALAALAACGATYHGWAANAAAPAIFHRHLFTVHVPRRFYTTHLPGIPTIRVFEALACGIPLLSAPWADDEHLFSEGDDFLMARNPSEMERLMGELRNDPGLRQHLAENGLRSISTRHTCRHRAQQLLGILGELGAHRREVAA